MVLSTAIYTSLEDRKLEFKIKIKMIILSHRPNLVITGILRPNLVIIGQVRKTVLHCEK